MNWWKRHFGLDLINTTLVTVGSFFCVIFVGELTGSGELALGAAVLCLGGFGLLRYYALKAQVGEGETSGSWRLEDVEARLAELESLQARVAELEERVDFSERLLASKSEPARWEGSRG